jgi:hypothetical protein
MSDSHSEDIQATPPRNPGELQSDLDRMFQEAVGAHGAHAGHGRDAPVPFSDAEIARFQREDRYAGGAIVVLMTSIFSIGVVLYSIVLLSCI